MNGDFSQGGTVTFKADLPQEVIDKVLANTKEDMEKWLEAGNTFDLSDGADRTVTYISFPKGTKPEDIVRVVRCGECRWWSKDEPDDEYGYCCNGKIIGSTKENWHCADGKRRNP